MASQPNDAAIHNSLILQLNPHEIEVADRIGMFFPNKAAALGKLIAADGQNDPIKVKKNGNRAKLPWRLVAGHHRLEGAKMEELRLIDAIEVWGSDEQLREIEASENMHRRSFGPIERACFVRAIADAAEQRMRAGHEGLTQQQIAIRKRWEDMRESIAIADDKMAEIEADNTVASFATVYGWQDHVAAAIGLSKRTVRDDLALHRALVAPFPDLAPKLAAHDVIGQNASALREIAAIKSELHRRAVIELLLKCPGMSVAEAKIDIGLRKASAAAEGATKHMNNLKANLDRLSAAHQMQVAPAVVEKLKPSALIVMRDLIGERLATLGIEGADA
jgi:hypothetical protein